MEKVDKEYRIVTRMTMDGEEFHPQFKYVLASETEWRDLIDTRWDKWYPYEKSARLAIESYKKIVIMFQE